MGKKYRSNTPLDSALQVMRPNPAADARLGQSVIPTNDGVHFKIFTLNCALKHRSRGGLALSEFSC
jgi:hypothetical protein